MDSPWSTFDSNCVLTFHRAVVSRRGPSVLSSCPRPPAQLRIGQQQAGTVVLAELSGRVMEEPRRGLLLVLSPGPQATTVRLPLVVEDDIGGLAVEFLLDQGRLSLLFLLSEAPGDQTDLGIRDIGLLPDGRVARR